MSEKYVCATIVLVAASRISTGLPEAIHTRGTTAMHFPRAWHMLHPSATLALGTMFILHLNIDDSS